MDGTREHAPVTGTERPFARPVPLRGLRAAFATVRFVKFCVRTAHSTVTEKYDGGAAHTASGRFWEAA